MMCFFRIISIYSSSSSSALSLKRILCTQPRRIAAHALASHVAELSNTRLGEDVGYAIGGAHEMQKGRTRLLYMTTAIAMMQFLDAESGCVPYTHLIIDEVHERSIYVDVLLTLVKLHHLQTNVNLRVILMSAAANCNELANYFLDGEGNPAPVLRLESGTPHRIREKYLEDLPDYIRLQSDKVSTFCYKVRESQRSQSTRSMPIPAPIFPFDDLVQVITYLDKQYPISAKFLVFLPGVGDIQNLAWRLDDEAPAEDTWVIEKLHSRVPVEQQKRILSGEDQLDDANEEDKIDNLTSNQKRQRRHILLGTDIVETSVTIPECEVVIDTCCHRRRSFNPMTQEYQLMSELISADEALQRRGRTGRTCPGTVWRLIPRDVYQNLIKHPPPEMQKSSVNIADVLLALQEGLRAGALSKSLGNSVNFNLGNGTGIDAREFLKKCPAPPNSRSVDEAFARLVEIGAISQTGTTTTFRHPYSLVDSQNTSNQGLTYLGRVMRKLTFDLDVVRLVFNGVRYGIIEEVEILAGLLRQNRNPFIDETQTWANYRLQAVQIKSACSKLGDPIARMRAVQAWEKENRKRWSKAAATNSISKLPIPDNSDPDLEAEDRWCWSHYLSLSALQEVQETRIQIREALVELGLASPYSKEFVDSVVERGRRRRKWESQNRNQQRNYNMNNYSDNFKWDGSQDPVGDIRKLVKIVEDEDDKMHQQAVNAENYGEANRGYDAQNLNLSSQDKIRVLSWILASSYPQNIVKVNVKTVNSPLIINYTSRKSNLQFSNRRNRRKHYQNHQNNNRNTSYQWQNDVSSKQYLEWFLNGYLGLSVKECVSQSARHHPGAQEHRVTFTSKSDFHSALQLSKASGAEYPYVDAKFSDYSIDSRRECFADNRGYMLLSTDSVCDLFEGGIYSVVASSILPTMGVTGKNTFICMDLTRLPSGLKDVIDEATSPLWPNLKFKGVNEGPKGISLVDSSSNVDGIVSSSDRNEIASLVNDIYRNMDIEFSEQNRYHVNYSSQSQNSISDPAIRHYKIVNKRVQNVIRIMKLLESIDETNRRNASNPSSSSLSFNSLFSTSAANPNRSRSESILKDITIPFGKAKFVIGKGGSMIKQMKTTSGAQIEVSKDGIRVTLKGTQEQVNVAEVLVKSACRM